jgi:phosphate starvation-inducible protein PhoH
VFLRLEGMPDFGMVSLTRDVVVRSGFCQRVLERYDE